MIAVDNINKSYGDLQVVKAVSFEVNKGEIVGFLGPNGAGKSTTLKILATALFPNCGTVKMDGKDIFQDADYKRKIGFLPEDNPLYGNMYVKEYLEYAAKFYLPKQEIKNAVEEVIETCGLQDEYRKTIDTLSKGNRQRVGLAQAIIHKPDFLILDEPTAGLDPNQQEEIQQVISNYSKEKQVLFSTHSLEEAQKICFRIMIIHKGEIRANEKTDAIDSIEDLYFEMTE